MKHCYCVSKSSDLFYIVSYYMKSVTNIWTYSIKITQKIRKCIVKNPRKFVQELRRVGRGGGDAADLVRDLRNTLRDVTAIIQR